MAKRLSEIYKLNERVEIYLQNGNREQWVSGRVVGFDFPGIWVQTDDGYRWFVTNQRRIRPLPAAPDA